MNTHICFWNTHTHISVGCISGGEIIGCFQMVVQICFLYESSHTPHPGISLIYVLWTMESPYNPFFENDGLNLFFENVICILFFNKCILFQSLSICHYSIIEYM